MKKLFMPFIMATVLLACSGPAEKKAETTATSATGTVTATGPDVDLMKKAAESWAKGDWDAYLSCYADTAVSVHNAWATYDTTVAKKMPSFIDLFKKSREKMDGNINIDNAIYEVVTMPDGNKYGHAWVGLSWKLKSGEVSKTVLFNSFGIKDGKITYEWPIYNTKEFDKLTK